MSASGSVAVGTNRFGQKVVFRWKITENEGKSVLSMVGDVLNHHGRIVSCGQFVREAALAPEDFLSLDVSEEKLSRMVEVWKRWHCNDMRPGCEHQAALGWRACPGHYGKPGKTCSDPARDEATADEIRKAVADALKNGAAVVGGSPYRCAEDKVNIPCPVCGYKFGSKWLHEELPPEIAKEVASW